MNDSHRLTSRCSHCPRAGLPCRGEEAVRLCELINPEHAAFNPAYRDVLAPTVHDPNNPDNPSNCHIRDINCIPLAESLRLTALVRGCAFRSPPACGCQGAAACALKGGADVPTQTCWDCVRRYGRS
jgi:hypothetical protein